MGWTGEKRGEKVLLNQVLNGQPRGKGTWKTRTLWGQIQKDMEKLNENETARLWQGWQKVVSGAKIINLLYLFWFTWLEQ